MKIFFTMLITLCALPLTFAQVTTKLLPVDHIYVPSGFDDNDSSEIVIAGHLPDTCYKAPKSQYIVQGNRILVTVSAIHVSGIVCSDLVVPFIETVRLGALKSQRYQIIVNNGMPQPLTSNIAVKKATWPSIDNFDYMYVVNVRHLPGDKFINLDGYTVSDCFTLDRIEFQNNGVDTYAVLPIMKKISEFCPMKMTPVSFEVALPNTISRKEILLHVRSMQGNSVNSIYYQSRR